jgi:menaquinone reductase, multiheme cytochrome c subunit
VAPQFPRVSVLSRPSVLSTVRTCLSAWALALLLPPGSGCQRAPAPVTQPMAMSHKRHMEADMKCITCHPGAEDQVLAQFPTVVECMDCHHKPKGAEPDEPLVRQYAERKQEIPWVRVDRLAGHVYFSHGPHVTLAKMKCEECHLGILAAARPLLLPDIFMSMADCMRCHREKQASNQCTACHK